MQLYLAASAAIEGGVAGQPGLKVKGGLVKPSRTSRGPARGGVVFFNVGVDPRRKRRDGKKVDFVHCNKYGTAPLLK